MAQNRQDMGSGPVKPLLLQLMIPAVVAQVVNLLYNIVDRIYIGHIEGIGAAALTGVGLFAPILMLLNAFAMLIGAGGAPRTAIALGQGNKDEAEKIIGNSFTKDAVEHLPKMVSAADIPTLKMVHLYYGGRTIPEYADGYLLLGLLQREKGLKQESIENLKKAQELGDTRAEEYLKQ